MLKVLSVKLRIRVIAILLCLAQWSVVQSKEVFGDVAKCDSDRHIELVFAADIINPVLEDRISQQQRFSWIEKDATNHFRMVASDFEVSSFSEQNVTARLCGHRIQFDLIPLPAVARDKTRLLQGYGIEKDGNLYRVRSYSSVGSLYGFYAVMDNLGFRWVSPDDTVVPTNLEWERVAVFQGIKLPKLKWRGFHSYDHDPDLQYLEWMARNRLNLIGAYRGAHDSRKMLGIYAMQGGHNVITALVGSDVIFNGRPLIELHPEWYAKSKNPTPAGASTYTNPCYGDPTFVAFFGRRLAEELKDGRYKDTDILHLWPSDQRLLAIPKTCQGAASAKGDVGQLLEFYSHVSKIVASEQSVSGDRRKITIAAIGYNDTYFADLQSLENSLGLGTSEADTGVDLSFAFFPILRSHATPLFGETASAFNAAWGAPIAKALAHSAPQKIGIHIFDYLNVSTNAAIASPGVRHLPDELALYAESGAESFAYMHPLRTGWGPGDLAHRLISVIGFDGKGDTAKLIENHYEESYGTVGTSVSSIMARYENAVRARSEMLGNGSSLSLFLRKETLWGKGILSSAAATEEAAKFVLGGRFQPHVMRLGTDAPLEYETPPLAKAISEIRACAEELRVLAGNADGRVARRLRRMEKWVAHSEKIFTALLYLYEWRVAVQKRETSIQKAKEVAYREIVGSLIADTWWANYLSPIDGVKLIEALFVNVPGPMNPLAEKLITP